MSKNTRELPFTEIVERVSENMRIRSDQEKKVRGIINDVYVRDIPRKEDWSFLVVSSTVTTVEEYTTGNATINTGGTTITFSSTFVASSSFIGRQIKISGNDYVYELDGQSGSTGMTIQPPFSGNQNVSGAPFSIFEAKYSLAGDFDRFPKNGGLYKFQGGAYEVIPEYSYQDFRTEYSPSTTNTPTRCILLGADTAGNRIVEISPPAKIAVSLPYDYYKVLRPMRETTGFLTSIGTSQTAVTGSSGFSLFTEAVTGWYLRVDAFGTGADSEWYPIAAITTRSNLTLAVSFGLSAAGTTMFTLCPAPDMPVRMHPAVMYGAMTQIAADQNDPLVQGYMLKYAEVLSDGKILYKTRTYSQQVSLMAEDYLYRR